MKIGLIREGKVPPDTRVPLTPEQCTQIIQRFGLSIVAEPSPIRCFADDDYRRHGIPLQDGLSDCDILMGVKEVPVRMMIPGKSYFFFSHTIKKQAYNRDLLRAILAKNIRLIDYEVLTDEQGRRLIAFGKFAGMVGAHNGIMAYGERTGLFHLRRMKDCLDYAEAQQVYQNLVLPPMKIVLTGTGRVASGAALVLRDMNIRQVSPTEFLHQKFEEAVFTQLGSSDYVAPMNGTPYNRQEFHQLPEKYRSIFQPYYRIADVFINGIFWNNRAPAFFTKEEMRCPDFHIQVIADVTCDIAPLSSVPSTIRASSIAQPVYGYDPQTEQETEPGLPAAIDIMAIDNLPSELPRDASREFGNQFMRHILPELLREYSPMIERATIAENGELGPHFKYLEDYVSG
ncbi:MAG: alanine dehydrogenase [Phaeodactylibacter sp.]|nr:alanine dehydrogenase [Phaeodactylibacter sp.]MCB9274481.1 alanine dehydrogenase [Lewinellaceae bacterium]